MSEVLSEPVGPVVGPVSAGNVFGSAESFLLSGAQYDIAIGGLPFVKAPSDERPYARETAEFRKQQIDQSNTVGDQSLTGFWTRGQLSFHRGAGINFYEVLDGEAVFNRFTDAQDVDVWTPGEVTVKRPRTTITADGTADVLLWDGVLATRTTGGNVHERTYAGVATAKPSTDGNPFSSIDTDGTNIYGTNGAKIEKCIPGGSFATLWTHHVPGRTWLNVWWAKQRLWAVDSAGELFTLSTVGGTTAGGDILWTSGRADATWTLTDSDGGVFIASGNTVYMSTTDASAATPVLGAPVSVASVGAQETISTIGSYLGHLVVCSGVGVRMGRIQANGVLLGNLIFAADASDCTRLAFRESVVLTTATVGSACRMYEVNVLDQTTELSGAYAPVRSVATSPTAHGSFVLPDGRVGTFSSAGISLEDAASVGESGYVQTAFHRFGTLEPKDFRSLTVRAEGSGGTVAVSKVARDGTVTSLVTLGEANFYENEISLNLSGPTDYIGLRFTLNAVAGESPTLLGYQLRALPAPERQRLIQIPLMCFDTEQVGSRDYGHRGWAWERLEALEDMERDSGTVTYQDFNTGETATVMIESVQFQNKTPPRSDSNGFGGFIVLTLRKVT